jgi:hypothetical protein
MIPASPNQLALGLYGAAAGVSARRDAHPQEAVERTKAKGDCGDNHEGC